MSRAVSAPDSRATARAGAPSPTSRETAKAETREALLEAGLAEIAERGIDAPSLDAICARAGYTRGAFYVHFRDREDFLVAVMERTLGAFLDAVIAGGGDREERGLAETVSRFAGALGLRDEGPVPLHRLLEVCERAPEFRERFVRLLAGAAERVGEVARAGQRAGSVRDDVDPETLASLLLTLALGSITALQTGLPLDVPAARDAVLRLLGPARPA